MLKCDRYDELIDIALSDDLLPEDNLVDARNIRVYRLRFALQAALRVNRRVDAAKVALRAGEEISSDERQNKLFKENIDLIAALLSAQRVEEMAYQRVLSTGWRGSENMCAAALLSTVPALHADARLHLGYAKNWLRLFFQERDKSHGDPNFDQKLEDTDVAEFCLIVFNLHGPEKAAAYLGGWSPDIVAFDCGRLFARRLIDLGQIDDLVAVARSKKCVPHLGLAIVHELGKIGHLADQTIVQRLFDGVARILDKALKPTPYKQNADLLNAILTYLEACARGKKNRKALVKALETFGPARGPKNLGSEAEALQRENYLRALCLRFALAPTLPFPSMDELKPEDWLREKPTDHQREQMQDFESAITLLMPWYRLRARLLLDAGGNLAPLVDEATEQSRQRDYRTEQNWGTVLAQCRRIRLQIAAELPYAPRAVLSKLLAVFIGEQYKSTLADDLIALRTICRRSHLHPFQAEIEARALATIRTSSDEGPDARSGSYIQLARAVLPVTRSEAAAYFDAAIEALSQFGDEIVERWEAVASAADAASSATGKPELAYRFIRCAELVGQHVVREKHWSRDAAMQICGDLHFPSAIAAHCHDGVSVTSAGSRASYPPWSGLPWRTSGCHLNSPGA